MKKIILVILAFLLFGCTSLPNPQPRDYAMAEKFCSDKEGIFYITRAYIVCSNMMKKRRTRTFINTGGY